MGKYTFLEHKDEVTHNKALITNLLNCGEKVAMVLGVSLE